MGIEEVKKEILDNARKEAKQIIGEAEKEKKEIMTQRFTHQDADKPQYKKKKVIKYFLVFFSFSDQDYNSF